MIEFNPYFRPCASEALYSEIFESIRDATIEKSAGVKINLGVDHDDAFDYETCKSPNFTKADYVEIVLNEAKSIH